MYGRPGVIYGFHGCDKRVGEAVLSSHTQHLKASENVYDWLGHGIYFWEASPERGLEFAREAKIRARISKGRIRHPYVIGAVIELGNCLNLLDHAGLMEMQDSYRMFKASAEAAGEKLPSNKLRDRSGAYATRALDCAVLEYLHRESGRRSAARIRYRAWRTEGRQGIIRRSGSHRQKPYPDLRPQ